MARSSEEFILAWSALAFKNVECEEIGWQAIFLPSAGSVEVQAGLRSPNNEEAVLFSFPNARITNRERLPEGKGFLVEKTETFGSGGVRLALTRKIDGDLELFTTMVCDIVGSIDVAAAANMSESGLLQTLIKRVLHWQRFMSRNTNPLSPEAELGLAGELYFVKVLLKSHLPSEVVLNAWVGPEDAQQDFLLGQGAIEVKATMSSSGFPVKIGSLEQLDDAVASPLFLAAVKFVGTDEGMTLSGMVTDIEHILREEPEMVNLFYERLLLAGYTASHSEQYTRQFEPKEQRIFIVTNDFPRMTTASVPAGVIRAIYEINLDQVKGFFIELDTMLKKLGVTG
ncbi:MAG: hypothetical protein CML20_13065 [Rheinheimera sp.]|uniref:PD-(D/E)XK motif protein n=1 Tax=Arsukibacterium sp. UBA3155 TaxID=1946058 RepID=UPI000C8F87BB|nr:PD-(D/E)XK motif protein [Arsukibacterium sp. UBA3155]MAD75695.1 hypothetical protein [Rheinheimera sp.]|tara:strand:- start:119539 stop:120561 length:1023 start_codon:yes stop_codon:yes gene_type:complete